MSVVTAVFVGVAIFWIVAYFFHTLLRTCQNYPYIWFLKQTGISVHFGFGRWYTTSFNRTFQKFGSWKPRLLHHWFNLGAIFGLLLIVPSLVLLAVTAGKYLIDGASVAEQTLTPVFPGVNLPFSEVFYYLLTLLLCSVIHELGHAVAAIRDDVRVLGCGLFVLGVLPAAFVELPPEQLRQLTPWQQLRIFCAGVWHNLVLVLVAVVVLAALPLLFAGMYSTGSGVVTTHIQQGSGADGRAGLAVGDTIVSVGDCQVVDTASWYRCLVLPSVPTGYCTDNRVVDSFDETVRDFNRDVDNVECCPKASEHGLCFKQNDPNALHPFVCMPARQVLAQAPAFCNTSTDCPSTRYTCLVPAVDATTKLLPIRRQDKEDVLFLGHPGDLYYSVSLTDYHPKWSYLPLRLPSMLETLCRYVASFSGALAILNAVPCFGLDGQWITQAAIDLLLINLVPCKQTRNIIFTVLLATGTALLVTSIIAGVVAIL